MNNATEHYVWTMVNALGWWWWGPIAVMAAVNLWNIYRLAAAQTLYGRVIRIVAITGFMLIAASPGNSAFGPLGLPLVLLSYMGMTHQMYRQCLAAGKIKKPEGPPSVRVAALLVEPK